MIVHNGFQNLYYDNIYCYCQLTAAVVYMGTAVTSASPQAVGNVYLNYKELLDNTCSKPLWVGH